MFINQEAILNLNQPLQTRKDFWHDKPNTQFFKLPVVNLQLKLMLIMPELLWEEFYHQGIPDIFSHTASHKASKKNPKKKVTPLLIPYGRFSKHSTIHYYSQGNLEMVAENTKKTPQESASMQPATKRATPKKHTTTTPVKQSKPAPPPTKKPSKRKLPKSYEEGSPLPTCYEDMKLNKNLFLREKAFLPQGRAPVGGVTIRDPVSETTSKLHEVVGKGKAVVTEEQVAHSLINLSKKKRTTDQFILVRRDQTPPDSTTGPSSQPDDDTSEKDQGEVDSSTVTSGVSIPVSDPEAHEALAGPDPEPMKEDQTGSDSGKLHVSLAGPNPEHMDDEFLATAYPKVHENLKLITDERVIDDKPESHSGSMSSMKNLDDTFNFGDQFLYDKPTEDDQEKSKVREESESTIPDPNQTVTSTPPVIAPFTDVSSSKPSLLVTPPPINTEATTITTSLPEITPFIALQLRVARLEQEMSEVKKTDHSADVLERHTADLIEKYSVLPGPESVKNQESEKSPKEIIRAKKEQGEEKQDSTYSIRSTDKMKNAMDKEVADKDDEGPCSWIQTRGKVKTKRRRSDSAASGSAHPPPKDDVQSSKKPRESDASATKQHPAFTSSGWQITDTRDAGNDSDMEDTDNAHIPKVSTTTWFKPIPESERPATPEPEWTIPPNDFPEPENNWANTYATAIEEALQADLGRVIKILRNIYEPLPLGGPPGQVTIQPQFFFNKDLDYLLTGDKERRIALSISKLKAARYLDFGLEELVPSLWVESEREYDISAVYGITHWWFRRKEFYINKHSEPSDREAVRSQMRILSVISVQGIRKIRITNYLREIILRRADYQEYKISEKDFKNLHPNDFEDLFLLNIQEKLNHLPKTDKTSLHTAVNMWIRNLVPTPRAVVYRDRNDQRKFDELIELHKLKRWTIETRRYLKDGDGDGNTRSTSDIKPGFCWCPPPNSSGVHAGSGGLEAWLGKLKEDMFKGCNVVKDV
ncbi:hypothetical protein Tco_1335948 [Tanacetum coccineum]